MIPTEPAYLLGTGGALGAVCRHLAGGLVTRRFDSPPFPIATLVINVVGSFALGLLLFSGVAEQSMLFFGVGVCGSFTTYSSFSVQTVRLWEGGRRGYAVGNAVGNFLLSAAAGGLAWLLVGSPF